MLRTGCAGASRRPRVLTLPVVRLPPPSQLPRQRWSSDVAAAVKLDVASLASLPLKQEPTGLPKLRPASALPPPVVQVSTLANGLRVSTQETYGQVASLALFIDSGSMYENEADGTLGARK